MQADSKSSSVRVRSGGTVLSLIAGPLSVPILRAHVDGPLRLSDLRERIGGAAQTTLRGQIGNLRGIGALKRRAVGGMPYAVENELTDAGHAVLAVADLVEVWLTRAPQGPIALGSEPAKGAIRALIGGWGSAMLRALAARPLSLTELSSVIGGHSYPALERRLSAMRAARLVEPRPGERAGGGKPYAVTEWARMAVGPLVAAGRCECRHMADAAEPLTRIDVEAGFLLAVPLMDLQATQNGSCLLAVDTGADGRSEPGARLAGVHVQVQDGAVVSCVSRLEQDPGTWVLGTVDTWVGAILQGESARLRIGGRDLPLAGAIVSGLHEALTGV